MSLDDEIILAEFEPWIEAHPDVSEAAHQRIIRKLIPGAGKYLTVEGLLRAESLECLCDFLVATGRMTEAEIARPTGLQTIATIIANGAQG